MFFLIATNRKPSCTCVWGLTQMQPLGWDRLGLNPCSALTVADMVGCVSNNPAQTHTASFQRSGFVVSVSHTPPLCPPLSQSLKSILLRMDTRWNSDDRDLRRALLKGLQETFLSLKNDHPGRQVSSAAGFDWIWSLKMQHYLSPTRDRLRTGSLHPRTQQKDGQKCCEYRNRLIKNTGPFSATGRHHFLHPSSTWRARPTVKALW